MNLLRALFVLVIGCFTYVPFALAAEFPSSRGEDAGDHLRLLNDVYGFVPVSTAPGIDTAPRCAGRNTSFAQISENDTEIFVKFYSVETPLSADTCSKGTKLPVEGSVYKIDKLTYQSVGVKHTGLAFGALVVPFKFRLGSDKKLVSSSTIAPFIGIRWSKLQGFGYEFMPVVSAGLGLVPVADPGTGTTDTKSAFSTALGITLTNTRNADFSAGVLVGKDFLSKSDRALDPSVNKVWISIWLGVSR